MWAALDNKFKIAQMEALEVNLPFELMPVSG